MLVNALADWRSSLPVVVNDFVVGFSGGQDSHALLHALYQCSKMMEGISLRAVHIHHGLYPEADQWASHCQNIAENLKIPFQRIDLNLILPKGESVENIARKARYQAFCDVLQPEDVLLTAHHLEDQAETVLLQLLRGAGIKGLSGMATLKPFHHGWHARPLLNISKDELQSYAKTEKLVSIEDGSNHDLRFKRNFLRHRVMGLLKEMNPNYAACLARTAQHCQTSEQILGKYLENDLQACITFHGSLCVDKLKAYSLLHQEALFRKWLHKGGYPLPSSKKLRTMIHQMTQAKQDAHPCVEWGDWQISRKKGMIYVSQREKYRIESTF